MTGDREVNITIERLRIAFADKSMLTLPEACRAMRMTVKTVKRHIALGHLAYYSMGLGRLRESRRFSFQQLADFLNGRYAGLNVQRDEPVVHVPDVRKRGRRNLGQKVYFIRRNDVVKIGIAHDPRARMSSLQVANTEPLELLAVVGGGKRREVALHRQFKELALSGEWFRYDGPLRAYVEGLQQRALDQ